MKTQDYLSELPEVPGQKYALITIIGPHMSQKSDVWGLRVCGTANSLEQAKTMTKRVMKIENTYDIYTVEVGKFFPLAVEPYDVKDVEYENEQLNKLVKGYLENREQASDHFAQRKRDMMEKAIKEGKKEGQEELTNKQEHPMSVLERKHKFEERVKELKEELESYEKDLQLTVDKYTSYTEEERQEAESKLTETTTETETTTTTETDTKAKAIEETKAIDDIRKEIMDEIERDMESDFQNPVKTVLEELQNVESEIKDLYETLSEINKEHSPNAYDKLNSKINTLEQKRETLKVKLNDKKLVNEYINKGFVGESDNNGIFDAVPHI